MRRAQVFVQVLQVFSVSLFISVLGFPLLAQGVSAVEKGKFRIFISAREVGEETYEVTREGDVLTTKSNFKFTDRGTEVPLLATLKTKGNYTPLAFDIKGKISRRASIDTSITINGSTAEIREGKTTRQASVPTRFFTFAGSLPYATQQIFLRYVRANKIKTSVQIFPDGQVSIEDRGFDEIKIGDKAHKLRRFQIGGLDWGKETVWVDKDNNLVAAYLDLFHVAIRDGYESAYSAFTERAVADRMDSLAKLSSRLSPKQKGALVIKNVNVIDGTGRLPLNNAVIVIEKGRIAAIGPVSSVKVPRKARVVDGQGKYALPGLWDSHAHFGMVEYGLAYLAAGVTTVRDLGNEIDFLVNVRREIEAGRSLGPRVLAAGLIDGDGPQAIGDVRASTPEQAREAVNRYHKLGFEQIKIYSSVKPELVKVICDEAHRLGMTVTGHVPPGMNPIKAVEDGMDGVNHANFFIAAFFPKGYVPKPREFAPLDFNSENSKYAIKLFKERKIVFDPTLAILEWQFHPARIPYENYEPSVNKLPREMMTEIKNTGVAEADEAFGQTRFERYVKVLKVLHDNGLTVVAGTDGVVLGHSLKRELELYVKAGFTPMEAIQSATIVPARMMKKDKDLGTLEAGKIADLILVDGNPLENISNLRNTKFVVTNGRMFDCATLWETVGFKP